MWTNKRVVAGHILSCVPVPFRGCENFSCLRMWCVLVFKYKLQSVKKKVLFVVVCSVAEISWTGSCACVYIYIFLSKPWYIFCVGDIWCWNGNAHTFYIGRLKAKIIYNHICTGASQVQVCTASKMHCLCRKLWVANL